MTLNRFDFPKVLFRQPFSVSVEDGFRSFSGKMRRKDLRYNAVKNICFLSACVLAFAACAAEVPPGWRTAIDRERAAEAAALYATNGVRCVWAGDSGRVNATLPANAPFQFAVTGTEESVVHVQKLLEETVAALPPRLAPAIRRCQLLGPTVQWLLRSSYRNANPTNFFDAVRHQAVFSEADIDRAKLLDLARNMKPAEIPPAVTLTFVDEVGRRPLPPVTVPEAGVDYPGLWPETLYETPFGHARVLRAPNGIRYFRFKATAYPQSRTPASFAWVVLNGRASISSWSPQSTWAHPSNQTNGFGKVEVSTRNMTNVRDMGGRSRIDIAVFARWGEGPWGAPSILSFAVSPYEKRSHEWIHVRKIEYLLKPKVEPAYDLSSVFLPANWTDYYKYNDKDQVIGFTRTFPDAAISEPFSNRGERVIEYHPNETPKVAQKVRYFERDGQLRFEDEGTPIEYKLAPFVPRARGY